MYICTPEGTGSHGMTVIDNSELPTWVLGIELGTLGRTSSTAEPSLQLF